MFQNSDFRMVIYHIVYKMGSRAALGDKHVNISVSIFTFRIHCEINENYK